MFEIGMITAALATSVGTMAMTRISDLMTIKGGKN